MHVDKFIWETFNSNNYARWVLMHFRLPAVQQNDFGEFMKENKLFCTYEGVKYRCIGASRMGDVWLTTDFSRTKGYDLRVNVEACSEWSKE